MNLCETESHSLHSYSSHLCQNNTNPNFPAQPGWPNFNGKIIATQTGKGKYTMVFKRERDGGKEEWKYKFTDNGCEMVRIFFFEKK